MNCVYCGTAIDPATGRHADAWRDDGHRAVALRAHAWDADADASRAARVIREVVRDLAVPGAEQ